MRLAVTLALALAACAPPAETPIVPDAGTPAPPDPELEALARLSPAQLPSAPADLTNAWADDAAAARLGQTLFFTRLFAGPLQDADNNGGPGTLGRRGDTGKVACADCHQPEAAFGDARSPSKQISLGAGWTKRRAPALLDVGQARLLMWDGSRDSMFAQVFGPFENPIEMNSSRLFVAQQVFAHFRAGYEQVFGPLPPLDDAARFPPLDASAGSRHGVPGDGAELDGMTSADRDAVTRVVVNVGKAIGAYQRLLTCGPGRFDAWVHGDATALTDSEQRGARLFAGRAQCVQCHSGPFMSDQAFHNVGLAPAIVASAFIDADDDGAWAGLPQALADPLSSRSAFADGDDGRLPSDVGPALKGAFRTPTLRCVSKRPSFFHTGQLISLEAVVSFFNKGGHPGGYRGVSELKPLGLSPDELKDLVAFLKALDGPGPAAALSQAP